MQIFEISHIVATQESPAFVYRFDDIANAPARVYLPPMRQLILAALLLGQRCVRVAVCPFNMPEVTIQPQQIAGFSWGPVIRPMKRVGV
jgi:hypothetical protein